MSEPPPTHHSPLHKRTRRPGSRGAHASRLLVVAMFAILYSQAHAQGAVPEPAAQTTFPASRLAGRWHGPARVGQMELRLIVLDAERGAVAAALTVSSPQCSGGLDSLGQWQQGTLVLKPYRPESETDTCEVRVRVDAHGRQVWVSEKGCGAYHGVGCVFEGTLQAR